MEEREYGKSKVEVELLKKDRKKRNYEIDTEEAAERVEKENAKIDVAEKRRDKIGLGYE